MIGIYPKIGKELSDLIRLSDLHLGQGQSRSQLTSIVAISWTVDFPHYEHHETWLICSLQQKLLTSRGTNMYKGDVYNQETL